MELDKLGTGSLPEKVPSSQALAHKTILSADGGGVRGLLAAIILDGLEKDLSAKFKFKAHIADYADFLAGTSTGSIIVLGLSVPSDNDPNSPKYQAETLVELYEKEAKNIFPASGWRKIRNVLWSKHVSTPLHEILYNRFGELTLSQSFKGIDLFVPTYDIQANNPYYFDTEEIRQGKAHDFLMRQAAVASSSAPTFLPPFEVRIDTFKDPKTQKLIRVENSPYDSSLIKETHTHVFVDGGIFMNDPSLAAYTKAKKKDPKSSFTLISIGTGEANEVLDVESLKKGGFAEWGMPISSIMMNGASKATVTMLNNLKDPDNATTFHLRYLRVQASLEKAVLDDSDDKTLKTLRKAAESVTSNSPVYKQVLGILTNICQEQEERFNKGLQNPTAENLDLSKIKINGGRIFILNEHLAKFTNLQILNLSGCGITDEALQKILFIGLKESKVLTSLYLAQNALTEAGIAFLADYIGLNPSLTYLDVSANNIPDTPQLQLLFHPNSYLKNQPSLQYLSLAGNKKLTLSSTFYEILKALTGIKIQDPLKLDKESITKAINDFKIKFTINLKKDPVDMLTDRLEQNKLDAIKTILEPLRDKGLIFEITDAFAKPEVSAKAQDTSNNNNNQPT